MSEPLTATEALRLSGFSEYRKTALTPISDRTFPPGTVYQTPEGLRAEDEETRCAFDVQGGIYPIRESVFQASYAAAPPLPASWALDVERLADAIHRNHNALACRHLEDRTDAQRIAAAYAAEGRPSDGR